MKKFILIALSIFTISTVFANVCNQFTFTKGTYSFKKWMKYSEESRFTLASSSRSNDYSIKFFQVLEAKYQGDLRMRWISLDSNTFEIFEERSEDLYLVEKSGKCIIQTKYGDLFEPLGYNNTITKVTRKKITLGGNQNGLDFKMQLSLE